MKKTTFLSIVLAAVLLPPFAARANNNEPSLEEVIEKIKTSQHINEIKEIDCQKVSDEQFESLGEALMDIMHPDEDEHKLMDQMMGGENSESLKAMHILMGKRYLGCVREGGMMGAMGMMGMGGSGISMMGNMMMGLGNYTAAGGWIGLIFMTAFLVLAVAGIIVLVKFLLGQPVGRSENDSALEILKQRYARGEISKEEFEEKKKDLSS